MIWIVDARHLAGWFFIGMSHDLANCCPMMYQIEWWGSSPPASCINLPPRHAFGRQGKGFSGQDGTWLQFTAGEANPHALPARALESFGVFQ